MRSDLWKCFGKLPTVEAVNVCRETIVKAYIWTREFIVVMYSDAPYDINVIYIRDGNKWHVLIGSEYVFLRRKNVCRKYQRNRLPPVMITIIEKILKVLKK